MSIKTSSDVLVMDFSKMESMPTEIMNQTSQMMRAEGVSEETLNRVVSNAVRTDEIVLAVMKTLKEQYEIQPFKGNELMSLFVSLSSRLITCAEEDGLEVLFAVKKGHGLGLALVDTLGPVLMMSKMLKPDKKSD